MFNETTTTLGSIVVLVASAGLMVILGLIFFLVNLWIIDIAAQILKLEPDASFVVLSAALLSAASMLGSKRR